MNRQDLLKPLLALLLGLAVMTPGSVLADDAHTSFCAKLSSENQPVCVPVENGRQAAWDKAAAAWKPGPIPSAPKIALCAAPGVSIEDLARNKNGVLVAYNNQVDVALAFAKTK